MTSDPTAREQWERLAAELRKHREAQRMVWGDLDNAALSRFLTGNASEEERGRVEAALKEHPELAKLMRVVGGVLGDFLPSEKAKLARESAVGEALSSSILALSEEDRGRIVADLIDELELANLDVSEEDRGRIVVDLKEHLKLTNPDVSEEERGRVEAALKEHPELAKLTQVVGGVLGDFPPSEKATIARESAVSRAWEYMAPRGDTLPPSAPALPEMPGAPLRVAGYEVLCPLCKGGFSVVYKAREMKLNRVVALKMIRSTLDAVHSMRRSFQSEAKALARLQHPNIVQNYEVGEHGGWVFQAMEFCEGGSLADRLRRAAGPLLAREAAHLVETLARAADHMHRCGIVHGCLKPESVLLTSEGEPKLTDFGLAKLAGSGEKDLEQEGTIIGVPAYMAPEQVMGLAHKIGPPADIYALGGILYYLLTGHAPFRGKTIGDMLRQVIDIKPPPVRELRPDVPRDLEAICEQCLQKDPEKRYSSALALAEDLARWRVGEPIGARPAGPLRRLIHWIRRRLRLS